MRFSLEDFSCVLQINTALNAAVLLAIQFKIVYVEQFIKTMIRKK